jgi:HSP20 family molecular chaperone IbpA
MKIPIMITAAVPTAILAADSTAGNNRQENSREQTFSDQVQLVILQSPGRIDAPPAELVEKETEYRIRLAVPGFEAKDIQVTVVPGVIVVEGETGQRSGKTEGKVLLTEFGARKLFRRLDMPSPIDVGKRPSLAGAHRPIGVFAARDQEGRGSECES